MIRWASGRAGGAPRASFSEGNDSHGASGSPSLSGRQKTARPVPISWTKNSVAARATPCRRVSWVRRKVKRLSRRSCSARRARSRVVRHISPRARRAFTMARTEADRSRTQAMAPATVAAVNSGVIILALPLDGAGLTLASGKLPRRRAKSAPLVSGGRSSTGRRRWTRGSGTAALSARRVRPASNTSERTSRSRRFRESSRSIVGCFRAGRQSRRAVRKRTARKQSSSALSGWLKARLNA